MLKKWLLLPVFLYSLASQAAIVDGAFSEWYWQSGNQKGALDYNFYGVNFDGSERIFQGGVVTCNYKWKCDFRLKVWDRWGMSVETYYSQPVNLDPNNHQKYTVDEFNQAVKRVLPFRGTIPYDPGPGLGTSVGCIKLYMSTGWEETQLASTCDGTLPPPPPPPSVPVFCSVSGLSSDTVDFGELAQGHAASRSITASLACSGDKNTVGKGRLLITDTARSGAATATLRNAQSGAEIKVRLSVGEENGSNEKRFDVRAGYQAQTPIYFSLDAGETMNKPGYFSGSALLIFDVL
ncbi:hypothetical protein SMETP3_43390 [Serratia marcescens]|uniref:hypothetical protein n=1 Tax=Serratia TaxID=613 RepID=UPI00102043B7|nr:hypothetical protein [Serratia marcescens]MBH2564612.1 hypothetical protein [Serratia marcescens]RZA48701.1 hypothetical protein EVY46_21635 [Serratia marcescens]BEN13851.1 hypothetical protein SMETP3_43390 [Serratia marcescens]